jgi:hypothetical protein
MNATGSHSILTIVTLAVAATGPARADERSVDITPQQDWTTMFSGDRVTLNFLIRSAERVKGQVVWRHTADRRPLARGELAIAIAAGTSAPLTIPLQLPDVREGVIYDTELTVELVNDRREVTAEHRRVVRIFPRDAFADRRHWLRDLNIMLYDPEKKTESVFDEADIPYKAVRNIAALRKTAEGIVVIGEGVSWQDHPSLDEVLPALAAEGIPVLCLAPADGRFGFPGNDDERPRPERLTLGRAEMIRRLDKRLDADAWPPEGKPVAAALDVESYRSRVVLAVTESPWAWPWVEALYPGDGRLIVCGFGVVRSWDAGPTPRYLLLRILERLSEKPKPSPTSIKQD